MEHCSYSLLVWTASSAPWSVPCLWTSPQACWWTPPRTPASVSTASTSRRPPRRFCPLGAAWRGPSCRTLRRRLYLQKFRARLITTTRAEMPPPLFHSGKYCLDLKFGGGASFFGWLKLAFFVSFTVKAWNAHPAGAVELDALDKAAHRPFIQLPRIELSTFPSCYRTSRNGGFGGERRALHHQQQHARSNSRFVKNRKHCRQKIVKPKLRWGTKTSVLVHKTVHCNQNQVGQHIYTHVHLMRVYARKADDNNFTPPDLVINNDPSLLVTIRPREKVYRLEPLHSPPGLAEHLTQLATYATQKYGLLVTVSPLQYSSVACQTPWTNGKQFGRVHVRELCGKLHFLSQ